MHNFDRETSESFFCEFIVFVKVNSQVPLVKQCCNWQVACKLNKLILSQYYVQDMKQDKSFVYDKKLLIKSVTLNMKGGE